MKKLLTCILATFVLLCIGPTKVFAEEKNKDSLVLDIYGLNIELEEYNKNLVTVEYKNNIGSATAIIRDVLTGEVIEEFTVKRPMTRAVNGPYIFVRDSTFNQYTKIRINITVDLYSSGSFSQINSIQGHNLTLMNPVSALELENHSTSAYSNKGFPTNEIHYAYNGTVRFILSKGSGGSIDFGIQNKLLSGGFSLDSSTTSQEIYRYYFSKTGSIKVSK